MFCAVRLIPALTVFLVLLVLAQGCSSGKGALKRGDYSNAVVAAVQRLRQNPDHKKSKQVLQMSYTLAVQYFDTEAQNIIGSNQPFKWRAAMQNYEQINRLYDEIRTSPGALAIIPKPENRFQQVEELKLKAAEESYQAGIEAMMKDTRSSYREAHGLFEETNRLSQGFREAIEMQEKARENATLFVIVGRTRFGEDWDFQQDLQSCNQRFVKFFSSEPDQLARYSLWVQSEVTHFNEFRPRITRTEEAFQDSVQTGEKKVGEQKIPIYENVSAKANIFTKTFRAEGALKVVIYGSNEEVVFNQTFERAAEESPSWGTFTGDERALPDRVKRLMRQREPATSQVRQTVHREIEKDIRNSYCSFLDRY
jgi:hypothetical protein